MPELPEVEVVAGGLTGIVGQRLLRAGISGQALARGNLCYEREDGGFTAFVGKRLVAVGRRGKYAILQFSTGKACLVHLGMTGSLIVASSLPDVKDQGSNTEDGGSSCTCAQEKHLHVWLDFNDCRLLYYDPRRFGGIELTQGDVLQHPWLARLGIEPLSVQQLTKVSPVVTHYPTAQLSAEYLLSAAKRRPRQALKQLLMDNAVITGIGNIYANEILFAAGFHPAQQVAILALQDWRRIVGFIQDFLLRAIMHGGCSIRDYRHSDGSRGHFQNELAVYGRYNHPCSKCQTRLEKMTMNGRSCVYCPQCQAIRR